MAVSNTQPYVEYQANGVATVFSIPFLLIKASDLDVFLGGVEVVSGFSIAGVGANTGTITFVTPPAPGTLSLIRNVPLERLTDYQTNGDLLAKSINLDFDRIWCVLQDVGRSIGRALVRPFFKSYFDALSYRIANLGDPVNPQDAATKNSSELFASSLVAGATGNINNAQNVAYLYPDGIARMLQTLANIADPLLGAAGIGFRGRALSGHLREKLYADRTYYVRTDGNDNNTGLASTAGGAFLTIQHAVDVIKASLDFNGYNVVIQVADGTYAAGAFISKPHVGAGSLYITGNVAAPANCIINATSTGFTVEQSAVVDIRGFTVSSSAGDGISAQTGGFMSVGPMRFGNCLASHIVAGSMGNVYLTSSYEAFGGGNSHWHVGSPGQIFTAVITLTVTGNPSFISYFAGAAEGTITVKDCTINGTAVGARYLAHKNGVIDTHPAYNPALPGTIRGRQETNGAFNGSVAQPFEISTGTASGRTLNLTAFDGASQLPKTILSLVCDPSGTGTGYLYVNGSDSYLSNRTHLGGTQRVIVSSGTQDGSTVDAGGTLELSQTSNPVSYMRRQGTDGPLMYFYKALVQSGAISVAAGATTYATTSDVRTKENIVEMDDVVADFRALRPVTYNFISDPDKVVHSGFIAHEVQEIVPGAVVGDKDAVQDVGTIVRHAFDKDPETGEITNESWEIVASDQPEPAELEDGCEWHKTGTAIVPQALDVSKLVPLVVARLLAMDKEMADLQQQLQDLRSSTNQAN
jgi:hypothetical protein